MNDTLCSQVAMSLLSGHMVVETSKGLADSKAEAATRLINAAGARRYATKEVTILA